MKEKTNCKIIQDLLPNYIEGLTNEETNDFIEKHMEECNKCKETLRNMQNTLKINNTINNVKEVKYIKKYNKKLRLLKVTLLIIVALFILRTGRNAIIIKGSSNKADKYISSNNYHKTITTYNGNSIIEMETYYKEGKSVMTLKRIAGNDFFEQIIYKDEKNNTADIFKNINGKKSAEINASYNSANNYITNHLETTNILEFIASCITSDIKSVECNGKKCYFINNFISNSLLTNKETGFYVEKETGLLIRYSDSQSKDETGTITDCISDYRYEFDNVTDEIFIEPDINEYIL